MRLFPRSAKARWRAGHAAEVDFWDRFLRERGGLWAKGYKDRLDPDFPLQPRPANLIRTVNTPRWKVLDVGAGPLTYLGKQHDGYPLNIMAVDPLAASYDRLLEKIHIYPLIQTLAFDAEELTDGVGNDDFYLKPETFDLVFSRNAIDHCYDPIKAIEQMIAVAKPGAYVLLEHWPNEAKRNKYHGLHRWNFSMDTATGDFLLSSRWRTWNLTDKITMTCTMRCEMIHENGEDWLITRIRKGTMEA